MSCHGPHKPSLPREDTDESLRIERHKTDRALAERQAGTEEDADVLVRAARDTADTALIAARERADRDLERADEPAAGAASSVVAQERDIEDEAIRTERIVADAALEAEREKNARALARLLPLEREKTDRFLWTERARSDQDISHRDDFLGIVSHDLRNLLSGIALSVELVAKRARREAGGEATLVETQRILRYAARMNRLIGDLSDIASIESGRLAMTPALHDASALIVEAVDTFSAAAAAEELSLTIAVAEPDLMAVFDPERMLQVLANLITNAMKFTPSGGEITIRGELQEDAVQISVSDTGCGIPADLLDAVFERFWQVGKNDRRGTGLGLYIARCIVEAHGGKIWVRSEPGVGSTFYFTVPRPA